MGLGPLRERVFFGSGGYRRQWGNWQFLDLSVLMGGYWILGLNLAR